MTRSRDTRVFRLTPLATGLNVLAACVLIVPGVVFLGERPNGAAGALLGASLLLIGVFLAWRVFVLRVECDDEAVRVVGLSWSRTIPRSRVLGVTTDIRRPSIEWRTSGGRLWSTPLTAVALGNALFVPRSARLRRIDFLSVLELWADGASLREAEQTMDARAQSRADPPVRGSRRDWRSRHDVPVRRADPFVEVADWAVPFLATILVVGATGIGKRGPILPLEVSSIVVVIEGGLLATVTLLVTARRTLKKIPDRIRRWPAAAAALAGVAGAGILLYRADQHAWPHPDVSWGVGACLFACVASALFLLVVRSPR
ncbi:hypothetical protein [Microbacterium sp. B19]|uniref:hypothetical protein n=1 Tax=Microbacterium sp. B19 TaxID=96765 RepID=UPI000349A05D|nr:hypothetical protein [Microbacterium sp. B19]